MNVNDTIQNWKEILKEWNYDQPTIRQVRDWVHGATTIMIITNAKEEDYQSMRHFGLALIRLQHRKYG